MDCTVVAGRNGTGKSLMARSLVDALWRLEDGVSSLNGGWEGLSLNLDISVDREYTILSDVSKSRVSGNSNNGLPSGLAGFFGRIPRQLYLTTSFLPSPLDYEGESADFINTIREIFLRDKSNFQFWVKRLGLLKQEEPEEMIFDRDIREAERALYECDKKVQLLEIRTSRSNKLKRERDVLVQDVEMMRASIEQYQKDQEVMDGILRDTDRVRTVDIRLEEIQKEITSELEKQTRAAEARSEIETQFPQFLERAGNPDLESLQAIFLEARDLNERREVWKSLVEKGKTTLKKWIAGINISIGTALLTLLYKNGLTLQRDRVLCLSLAAVDLVLSLALILILRHRYSIKRARGFDDERREIEKRLNPLLEETRIQLEGYSLSELYEFFLQYFEDYVSYSEKRRELGEIEASMREERYINQIRDELSSLREERDLISKRIIENTRILCLQDESGHTDEIQDLIRLRQGEIDILRDDISRKEKILSGIGNDLGSSIEEVNELEIASLEQENLRKGLEKRRRNREMVLLASNVMEQAAAVRSDRCLDSLSDRVVEIYGSISAESDRSDVNSAFVRDFILSGGRQAGVNPSRAYGIMLAIKLAMTDFLIDADMAVPLIMDDPFHTMDDDRVGNLRDIFRDISAKRQVILFTHRRDLADWGHYIEL